jgi:hypothetical protein
MKNDNPVPIVPGSAYYVKLCYMSYEKMDGTSGSAELEWDQAMDVRTPNLYGEIVIDNITPAGAVTGGAFSADFAVYTDTLIDSAKIGVYTKDASGKYNLASATRTAPDSIATGYAQWNVKISESSQYGMKISFSHNTAEDLYIRMTDVVYNGTEYGINCEVKIDNLQ